MIRWAGCALLVVLPAGGLAAAGVDYAESRHAELWLQHPVYGGPSFDAFVHSPQNPLHRGAPPYEWPVNSFFFADPVSGHWYVYVGDYCEGYAARPSRCVLLRSTDRGQSWTNLGVVLQGSKELFDQGGHTPDVSVVYAGGRYHMVYDWAEPVLAEANWAQLGGLAYAWAEKPEGPFHRAPQPITRNKELTPLLGKYRRTYAATLLRRKHDWMIVAMMDSAPNSWALFGITAPNPEGPYSKRVLLRNVEADGFHPPLLEFYPAFVHRGFVYAPATSVALNRNYNALFRAPLERAAEPGAWELVQNGSIWHAEDVENEAYGLWGQTFSGWVDGNGVLQAAFQSRDPKGMGTVNLAARPWNQPLRKSGFVMSGHQGPSLTLLQRAFAAFRFDAKLRVRGTVRLLVDYDGVLGPDRPNSDATLHPLALSRCDAVELNDQGWKVIRFGQAGEKTVLASGSRPGGEAVTVRLDRKPSGETSLFVDDRALWTGELPPRRATGVRPSSGAAGSNPSGTLESSDTPLLAGVAAPEDATPCTRLADASNGRVVLPFLPWRRGSGREPPDILTRFAPLNRGGDGSSPAETTALQDVGTSRPHPGSGAGGPSPCSRLPFVATFQPVAAPIYLADWLKTTASSPCPSPPKEERETAPRPVSTEMHVRCSEDGRTPAQSPSVVVPARRARDTGLSVLGIAVEPHSHLVVEQFAIRGKPQPATINYLFSEAILGSGGSGKDWQELRGPKFRYGLAAVSKAPGARVKWNVEGRQFTLWSPRGPEFGKAQVKVDGRVLANLDLHAERLTPSQAVWKSPRLKDGPHAVALTATDGLLVVDSIEVTR